MTVPSQAADPLQGEDLPDLRQLGVLLFGDSVDFRFLKFFCEFALGQEPKPFTFSDSDWLKLQGVLLAFYSYPFHRHIPQVWPSDHTCISEPHEHFSSRGAKHAKRVQPAKLLKPSKAQDI